jgi:hypothetical protein
MSMDQLTGLETCVACGQPFVVPVALLDLVDEGLYLLALQCNNCDCLTTGVLEDAELEALEHANERAQLELECALESFSTAGDVLPEDFQLSS